MRQPLHEKHVVNMSPKETEIDKLPKYCRYVSASETRGDYFEFEKQTDKEKICIEVTLQKILRQQISLWNLSVIWMRTNYWNGDGKLIFMG